MLDFKPVFSVMLIIRDESQKIPKLEIKNTNKEINASRSRPPSYFSSDPSALNHFNAVKRSFLREEYIG